MPVWRGSSGDLPLGALSTVTAPPWLFMIPCTIDSPSPVPSTSSLVV
jgi:hypothetical protein